MFGNSLQLLEKIKVWKESIYPNRLGICMGIRMNPFVYFFETPKGNYFYDVNSNAIVRVSLALYDFLKAGTAFQDGDREIKREIETLLQAGMLSPDKWEGVEHPATGLLRESLDGSIEMITLQITQQCNLRCKYCPYSGSYYNRIHSNASMDASIAKKAIDFYIRHSYDKKVLNIGFYGGEPLIQYDLMKELVEYSYQQGEGKEVNFHMTTNATLLDQERIRFLAENKFKLTISLDGPRELHDKNRESVNGKGSFDQVIRNVRKIQEQYPEYMKEVLFNCVMDGRGDFGCLNDFFTNFEVVNSIHTIFSDLAQEGIKDKELLLSSQEYDEAYQYEVFKLLLHKCNLISSKDVSIIVKSYYDHIKKSLKGRSIGSVNHRKGHPGGPCIPGVHKLFVNIHGDFYPCEKLNECICEYQIGNVDQGFDAHQVEKILNVGRTTEEECINCWCSRFCYQCILFSEEGDTLSAGTRKAHCKSVRRAVDDMFKDYCLIKEAEADHHDIYFL